MDLIILKIGGSIITYKEKTIPKVNFKNLKMIVNQLVGMKKKLILIHGAGSFGHQIVKRTGIHKGIKNKQNLVDFSETQRLQNQLNCIVTKELIKKGLPAFPTQPSSSAVMKKGKLVRMDTDVIKGLLKLNMIPVLYGVPAYDTDQGCSILSGDEIAPYLAQKLKAKKIIMASDTDGIFTSDPKKDKNAKQIKEINKKNIKDVEKMIGSALSVDVTGGMLNKVLKIIGTVKKGVPAQIISGLKKDNIKKALLGKRVGTIIKW